MNKDQDRLYREVQSALEQLIMRCPSSEARNGLCDANILIRRSRDLQKSHSQRPVDGQIYPSEESC